MVPVAESWMVMVAVTPWLAFEPLTSKDVVALAVDTAAGLADSMMSTAAALLVLRSFGRIAETSTGTAVNPLFSRACCRISELMLPSTAI